MNLNKRTYSISSIIAAPWFFPLAFTLFIVWQAVGIFPLLSYEYDSNSIAFGCDYTAIAGWGTLGQYGYGYWMQPLTHALIAALKFVFHNASASDIYTLLTAVSAIFFQYVCVVFASRLLKSSRTTALLALVLVPESYALSMYANSMALTGALFVWGICFVQNRKYIPAFALFTLAPLFRFDILLIYPTIPVMLKISGMNWRRSLIISAAFALFLCLFTCATYKLTGASISTTATVYHRWEKFITHIKHYAAVFGFYGLSGLAMTVIGLIACYRHRKWLILLLCLTALLVVHVMFFRFGNAAKHYAMLLPFVTVLGIMALRFLRRWHPGWLRNIASGALLISLFVGIRIKETINVPQSYLNRYSPHLMEVNLGPSLTFVVGGGQPFITADEVMLTSGQIFYPFFIHNFKIQDLRNQQIIADFCRNHPQARLLCASDEERIRLQMMKLSSQIADNPIIYDKEIEQLMQSNNAEEVQTSITKLIAEKYDNTSDLFLVQTEVTSTRWMKTLMILQRYGSITPLATGTSGQVPVIYHFNPNK